MNVTKTLLVASTLALSAASVFAGPVTEAKHDSAAVKTDSSVGTSTKSAATSESATTGDKIAVQGDTSTTGKNGHKPLHAAHHGKKASSVAAAKTPATTTAPTTAQ